MVKRQSNFSMNNPAELLDKIPEKKCLEMSVNDPNDKFKVLACRPSKKRIDIIGIEDGKAEIAMSVKEIPYEEVKKSLKND